MEPEDSSAQLSPLPSFHGGIPDGDVADRDALYATLEGTALEPPRQGAKPRRLPPPRPLLPLLLLILPLLPLLPLTEVAARGNPPPSVGTDSSAASLEERAEREVEELHRFFQDWFNGEVENTDDAYSRFSEVLAQGFVIVGPGGVAQERQDLLDGLRRAYAPEGTEPVELWIENFRLHRQLPTEDGDLVLVSYQEWQQRGESRRGRLSSALLREHPGTPNGLEWLHVHETWLPPGTEPSGAESE